MRLTVVIAWIFALYLTPSMRLGIAIICIVAFAFGQFGAGARSARRTQMAPVSIVRKIT